MWIPLRFPEASHTIPLCHNLHALCIHLKQCKICHQPLTSCDICESTMTNESILGGTNLHETRLQKLRCTLKCHIQRLAGWKEWMLVCNSASEETGFVGDASMESIVCSCGDVHFVLQLLTHSLTEVMKIVSTVKNWTPKRNKTS